MTVTSKQLLSVTEVATRLGLKPATIRRLILERRIPYVKLGRAVRIPVEAVEAMIAASYRPAIDEGTGRP
ncbi:MAG TPA: helix-turn-helix domain-containing protein [Nitrospiraceae bacterium]|nr:helix-turn-helix domain-containing protein [Nitrospiraceae bacterium]